MTDLLDDGPTGDHLDFGSGSYGGDDDAGIEPLTNDGGDDGGDGSGEKKKKKTRRLPKPSLPSGAGSACESCGSACGSACMWPVTCGKGGKVFGEAETRRRKITVGAIAVLLVVAIAGGAAGSMGGGGKDSASNKSATTPGGTAGAGGDLTVLDLNVTSTSGNGTVIEEEACSDHPDYLYLHNDGTSQNCEEFLSTNRPNVLENRCRKEEPRAENRTVRDWCRLTCDNCDGPVLDLPLEANETSAEGEGAGGNETEADEAEVDDIFADVDPSADAEEPVPDPSCYDDPGYLVLSDDGDPTESCDDFLATGRPAVLENRCQREQAGDTKVRDYCRLTCSNCDADPIVASSESGGGEEPAPAPSSDGQVPTLDAVSSKTTASPTLDPDCVDDADFAFSIDGGEQETCATYLATGRPAVLESRCSREEGGGPIRDRCRRSCDNCLPGEGGKADSGDDEGEADVSIPVLPSIVDVVSTDERFSTLLAAVDAAGLVEVLAGEGPLTVFGEFRCSAEVAWTDRLQGLGLGLGSLLPSVRMRTEELTSPVSLSPHQNSPHERGLRRPPPGHARRAPPHRERGRANDAHRAPRPARRGLLVVRPRGRRLCPRDARGGYRRGRRG